MIEIELISNVAHRLIKKYFCKNRFLVQTLQKIHIFMHVIALYKLGKPSPWHGFNLKCKINKQTKKNISVQPTLPSYDALNLQIFSVGYFEKY